MKILLINPPRSMYNGIFENAPEEAKKFIHKQLIGPPLGLLTIAEVVKDFDVSVYDMKGQYDLDSTTPEYRELTRQLMEEYQPDVVGVTFIASEFDFGIEIFRVVKAFNKQITTVAGGLHTTLCPDDFEDPAVDIVCPGQSAGIFREVILQLERKQPLDKVNNIILNRNGKLMHTAIKQSEWDAAGKDFYMPDRSHIKQWISTYKVGNQIESSTYIFSSLGCPYKCTFCSIWPQFDGKYYQRNIESIITELKSIPEYPIVRFADANTIVNIDFIDKLFDRIEQEQIKKRYIMDIRADTAVSYPWLIEKLARNGLTVVICGFESFREEELLRYNKSSKADLNVKAIEVFHANDIMLRGSYVIPSDYDENDFKRFSEFSMEHKVTFAGYAILTPMPGTILYSQMKDRIIDFDLKKYNFFNCVTQTTLPLKEFYENVARLWLIKKGDEVI